MGHLESRYTIRWRRGDPVAYVLGAQRIGDHGMADVVDTIPVSPTGWTDLAEIRQGGNGGEASTATSGARNQPLASGKGDKGEPNDDSIR